MQPENNRGDGNSQTECPHIGWSAPAEQTIFKRIFYTAQFNNFVENVYSRNSKTGYFRPFLGLKASARAFTKLIESHLQAPIFPI